MAKGRHAMPKNIRKKVEKQVKKDLKAGDDTPVAMQRRFPTVNEVLTGQPKKRASKEKSQLQSMEKSIARKKAKKAGKKLSKRTDPKDAIVGSVPAHVHPEGKRWMKTIVKQNKVVSKKITRKMNKRK